MVLKKVKKKRYFFLTSQYAFLELRQTSLYAGKENITAPVPPLGLM